MRLAAHRNTMPCAVCTILFIVVFAVALVPAASASAQRLLAPSIAIVSNTENDLWRLLSSGAPTGASITRYDTTAAAVAALPAEAGLMILADGYPSNATQVDAADLDAAIAKNLRVFVECPASGAVPGLEAAPLSPADYYHRVVVASDGLGPYGANKLDLLMAQGGYFVAVTAPPSALNDSLLVYDHVAGSTTAIYGLDPPKLLNPVLFQMDATSGAQTSQVLIAATKLTQFRTARYAPVPLWRAVLTYVLTWAADTAPGSITLPEWTPVVGPYLSADAPLPDDAERGALMRAVDWLSWRSGLYVEGNTTTCIAPYATAGSDVACVIEGYSSHVDYDGSQQLETAMAFGLGDLIGANSTLADQAAKVYDFVYFQSVAQQGPRANVSDPAYSLIAWGISSPSWITAFYGDDNARVLLASLAGSAALRASPGASEGASYDRWDEPILRAILANARTSSVNGFRPGRINLPDLEKNGWQYYFDAGFDYHNTSSPQPHYQSFLWATYLWAYQTTGIQMLYDKAEAGIRDSMDVYGTDGAKWAWTEYLSEERSHMLLPLAWLVRVNASDEHVGWLDTMVQSYIGNGRTQPSGAIQEWLGTPGMCTACPPASNAAYGGGEAPMIQDNGDTIADLLYSNNFAFVGLVEAAAATNNSVYQKAADGLASFLVRIQATSTEVPELHGAYFRAFDYKAWDFWGSASDWGWGPWSVETGWTEGWIAAGFALRALNKSMWELTHQHTTIDEKMGAAVCSTMLPQEYC